MKRVYLLLAVVSFSFVVPGRIFAQTDMFNGNNSSNWTDPSNWSLSAVPTDGETVIIPAGQNVFINATTVSLNGVTVKIQAGGVLQLENTGILELDNASIVSLEYTSLAGGGKIVSLTQTATDQVTIGGAIKFEGDMDYTSLSTGSSLATVAGPARADANTGTGLTGFALGSLPVVLVGFEANLMAGNKVNISWSTQQEISTDRFAIERSSDGMRWQTLTTVKASGFSSIPKNYSWQDAAPQKGANLYRLRIIDFDGNSGLTPITNVRLDALGKISVFPNPSVSSIHISLAAAPFADWAISLVNNNGQVILQQQFSKFQTTASLPVSRYPAGNYTLEITAGATRQSSLLMIAHQ